MKLFTLEYCSKQEEYHIIDFLQNIFGNKIRVEAIVFTLGGQDDTFPSTKTFFAYSL